MRAFLISIACVSLGSSGCQTQPAVGDPAGSTDAGPAGQIEIDLFGVVGHEFRFQVSAEQAMQMDAHHMSRSLAPTSMETGTGAAALWLAGASSRCCARPRARRSKWVSTGSGRNRLSGV